MYKLIIHQMIIKISAHLGRSFISLWKNSHQMCISGVHKLITV